MATKNSLAVHYPDSLNLSSIPIHIKAVVNQNLKYLY